MRWTGLTGRAWSTLYFWFPHLPERELSVVLRTQSDPAALAAAAAGVVRSLDPDQPVADVRVMRELVAAELARPQFTLWLLGGFAAVALILAALGLYGVLAFAVVQRTQEIGVRMALGAERRQVLGLILRRGLLVATAGITIGLVGAFAGARYLQSMLFGVEPRDPATFIIVAVTFALAAMLASYLPARRATKVDPMVALRVD